MRSIELSALADRFDETVAALESGESFLVTHAGSTVGELRSRRRRSISRDTLIAAAANLPRLDAAQFRRDVDSIFERDA